MLPVLRFSLLASSLFLSAVSSHAQYNYSLNNQTNTINSIVNWSGSANYVVGSNTYLNALIINSGGVLSNSYGILGYATGGSNNSATINGGVWSNRYELYIGYVGAGNSLVISNQGKVFNRSGYIGNSSSSGNRALVTGNGSVWNNEFDVFVGEFGTGNSLVITNQGKVFNRYGSIGYNSTASNNLVLVANTGSVWSNRSDLAVGYYGDANTLIVSNGATVFAPNAQLGRQAGSDKNLAIVTGPGTAWYNTGNFESGTWGASNQIIIADQAKVTSVGGYIGGNAGAHFNSIEVTGNGSVWSNSADLTIGNTGRGNQLIVTDGGKVVNSAAFLGLNAQASNNTALVSGTGALWINTNDLYIGTFGVGNRLTITNGGAVISRQGIIGRYSSSSNNVVTVGGNGALWTVESILHVGHDGPTNTLTIGTGGSVSASRVYVGSFAGADGNRINVTGGSLYATNAAGTGTLDIRRGTLAVSGGLVSVDKLIVTNSTGSLSLNTATLISGSTVFSNNQSLSIGNANGGATFIANGGVHTVRGLGVTVGDIASGNTLIVSNGAKVDSIDTSVGNGSSNNIALITGVGSILSNNNFLTVGGGSQNQLIVSSGGTAWNVDGRLGKTSNSVLVTDSGSTWINQTNLIVGHGAGYGNSLVISNGGTVVSTTGILGNKLLSLLSSNNSVLVTGAGSSWQNSATLMVGNGGGSNLLSIQGGAVTTSNMIIGVLPSSLNNSALVGSGNLVVTNAAGTGELDLRGGTLALNGGSTILDKLTATNGANSVIQFNGGTLNAKNITVANGSPFVIGDGLGTTATLEAAGGSLSFANGISNRTDGVIRGYGTLANPLANAGSVIATNGELRLTGAVSGTGSYHAGPAATLTFTGGGKVGSLANNGGTVRIESTLTNSSLFGNDGLLVVNGGTYQGNYAAPTTYTNIHRWYGYDSQDNVGYHTNLYIYTTYYASDLRIGESVAGAQLVITNGGRLVDRSAYLGLTPSSSNNTALVSGSGSVWNNQYGLYVGYQGSGNQLVISNGAQVAAPSGITLIHSNAQYATWSYTNYLATTSYLGHTGNSSNNLVVVTGPGSVWSNGSVYVGYQGSGNQVLVTNQGKVYGGVSVGFYGSNNAVVITGNDSSWKSVNGGLSVGYYGTGNEWRLENGATMDAYGGSIGYQGNSNKVVVTGGAVWTNPYPYSSLSVGGYTGSGNQFIITNGGNVYAGFGDLGYQGSNNTVVITGAGSRWESPRNSYLSISTYGAGNSLRVEDGAVASIGGGLSIGSYSNASGSASVLNGTLIATNGHSYIGGNGSYDYYYYYALAGGSGQMTLSNSTAQFGGLYVGSNPRANGTLNILGGSTVSAAWGLDIGGGIGGTTSTGTVTVANSTLIVTNANKNAAVVVGSSGRGSLTLSNSTVFADNLVVTNGSRSTFSFKSGTLSTKATTIRNGSDFHVGEAGGSATLNLSEGGHTFGNALRVGNSAGSTGAVTIASGTVQVLNGSANNTVYVGGASGKGSLTINGGSLYVDRLLADQGARSELTFNAGLIQTKSTTVNKGSSFVVGNGASAATLDLNGGNHTFSQGLTIRPNARVIGNGRIIGNVYNQGGYLSPGHSPGEITIEGDYEMDSNAVLIIELGGYDPGEFDVLNITGSVTFGGLLELRWLNDFENSVTNGSSFTVVTADGNTLELTDFLSGGPGHFRVVYDESNGTFANALSGQFVAVPEPGAALLVALGATCLLRRRRRAPQPTGGGLVS